jgi:hypothetical protein
MPKFKLFFAIIVFLLLAAPCYGQSTQDAETKNGVMLWSRNSTVFPWYFYSGDKLTADMRYNLDQDKTAGFCIGKSFGKKELSVIPEACGYAGKSNGYGPELWVMSDTKKYSVTSYIQYAKFLDTNSFGYAWLQASRKVGKRVELGLGSQAVKEGGNKFELDLGPAANLKLGHFTVSIVPLFRTTSDERGKLTIYAGLSYSF